jgi:hypothetical protein
MDLQARFSYRAEVQGRVAMVLHSPNGTLEHT